MPGKKRLVGRIEGKNKQGQNKKQIHQREIEYYTNRDDHKIGAWISVEDKLMTRVFEARKMEKKSRETWIQMKSVGEE